MLTRASDGLSKVRVDKYSAESGQGTSDGAQDRVGVEQGPCRRGNGNCTALM